MRSRRGRQTGPVSPKSTRALPVAAVVGSVFSLQFGSGYAATLFYALGAAGVTALRLGLSALVMLAIFRPRIWRWGTDQRKAVLGFGVAFAFMNGCFYAAISHIPFGIAIAIEFLGPLSLAAVLSRRLSDFLWVVFALAGVGLIALRNVGTDQLNWPGVLFAAAAGTGWAAYIVMGARVGALVPGHGGLAASLGVAAILVIPIGFYSAGTALLDPKWALAGLAVAFFSSMLPYGLEMFALKALPKKTFAILLAIEPAAGVLAGWVILDQQLDAPTLAGIACVAIASAGATLTRREPPPEPEKPVDAVLT